jgi:hypothetical protein
MQHMRSFMPGKTDDTTVMITVVMSSFLQTEKSPRSSTLPNPINEVGDEY